jgi:hypothetical protein
LIEKEVAMRNDTLVANGFGLFLVVCLAASGSAIHPAGLSAQSGNPNSPTQPVKLVFIHHSTGENWLQDDQGGLGLSLRDSSYFVSDTNYEWGPDRIGDYTDIGHWWLWFRGPNRDRYTSALYAESGQNSSYSRLQADPGGTNQIILFKSCFPNSQLEGNSNDLPTSGHNPLRGQDSGSEHMTVANAKGIYIDILEYFRTRQDKLFIVITAPPLVQGATDVQAAANARAFNDWLYYDWLHEYPFNNVAVFDFYNVLTSNGGNRNSSDLGLSSGNHHRWWDGAIQHVHPVANNFSAYGSYDDDSHPTPAGGQKASAEFVQLLNVYYNRFIEATPPPSTPTRTATTGPSSTHTPSRTATRGPTGTRTQTLAPGPLPTMGPIRIYLPIIPKGLPYWTPPAPTATLSPVAIATPTLTRTPTGIGCSGSLVVIQRGTNGRVADTYIWESEPDYTGNWETLYTGCVGPGRKQTLLSFDLSDVPSAATVHWARLSIFQRDATEPRTVNAHRILASWDEDAVTWRSFAAHFDRSASGSFSSDGSGWKQVDITALVQGWISGAWPNYGVLLDDPIAREDQAEEYVSSEDSTAVQRPKLEICVDGQ